MTELEQTIDREVGNDTEKSRLNFLKYVAYGKQLKLEEMAASQPIYTQVQLDEAVEKKAQDLAKEILADVDALNAKVGGLQSHVEKVDEDEKLAEITAKKSEDAAEVLKACTDLINDVDAKHTAILKDVREPGFAAIRAKYVK